MNKHDIENRLKVAFQRGYLTCDDDYTTAQILEAVRSLDSHSFHILCQNARVSDTDARRWQEERADALVLA